MNIKRFIFAAVASFFFTFASDFLIHATWLAPVYKADGILRPEAEQMARFPWMIAGHLLLAIAFPLLWAKFGRGGVASGAMFGFLIGLLVHAGTLFLYVSMPISGQIAASWFIAGVVQATVLGALVAAIYKVDASR
jgi:hypothetical protein